MKFEVAALWQRPRGLRSSGRSFLAQCSSAVIEFNNHHLPHALLRFAPLPLPPPPRKAPPGSASRGGLPAPRPGTRLRVFGVVGWVKDTGETLLLLVATASCVTGDAARGSCPRDNAVGGSRRERGEGREAGPNPRNLTLRIAARPSSGRQRALRDRRPRELFRPGPEGCDP